jgi:hypothetical protein
VAASQLNLRLAPGSRAALEALAFVRRSTPTALAREIIQGYLAAHTDEAGVRTALSALAEHDRSLAK